MDKKKKIQITIDGRKIECWEGQTILEAAKQNKIEIPALCFCEDAKEKAKANCRLCVVEIKGLKGLHPACASKVYDKMEVITFSPEIERTRKINLELIFAQHSEECQDCIWNFNCQLLNLARRYNIEKARFKDRKVNYPVYQFGPSLVFDSSKCIDCRNCVDICEKQGVGFLEIKEKGHLFQVVPSKTKDCIYCGQCIVHCPAGAFEAVGEFEEVEKPIQKRGKFVVFQFAPSIRTSIGEEFNLPLGSVVVGKLTAGIKKLGARRVFDVCVGADFTTVEEANEFMERLRNKKNLPMFTSCCPAWVRFVECYHPELIPNLTSARSPHIISGGLIKTYFAKNSNINPKDIIVVSVMPCVAKKYEIQRKELLINGLRPVDYVLTTRELAYLFIKNKIDLRNIKPQKPDSPLGISSGAGVIYGASGGVMESALRTIVQKTKKNLSKIEFKKIRGMEGVKDAMVKIKNKKVRVAVASGIGNAKKILERLKNNPKLYDYVEVMACFGGCIGGGGQPVPSNAKIRKERARGLYKIDVQKQIRFAHKNPVVNKVYQDYLTSKEKIHQICHTKYFSQKRSKIRQTK